MAEMINRIDQEDPKRSGERMVFDWFSASDIAGTVYYSFWQTNHRHKLFGEVDFLYVCARGILCIEVKGGTQIYRTNKIWHSVTRNNEDVEIHNPFDQGRECKYALEDYIKKTFKLPYLDFIVGYAVIFPECRFTGSCEDILPNVVFDGKNNVNEFKNFLESVFDFWQQTISERYQSEPQRLDNSMLSRINTILRGDFRVVPSLNLQFQHHHSRMLELTEHQYDVLDLAADNPRLLIQGAAGTGKSLLAVEMIRRCDAIGKRCLYVCYNKNMERYVDASVQPSVKHKVTTYHSLLMGLMNNTGYSLSVGELSELFIKNPPDLIPQYDVLVIDEGQDLLIPSCIDALDKFLVGGFDAGEWLLFLDVNQNLFTTADDCDFTIEYIKSLGHPVVYTLKENCRNTKDIAMKTSLLTKTYPAKYTRLDGPDTVFISYDGKADFLKKFKKEFQSLLSYGISVDDIVVLSKYSHHNSIMADTDYACGYEISEKSDILCLSLQSINYFTIQSFKGLEAKAVFLIDVDSFCPEAARALNYVGMSRAQTLLYVFYNKQSESDYKSAITEGLKFLMP